jgi:hypothetical protein
MLRRGTEDCDSVPVHARRIISGPEDYLDAACEAVCPLQPGCGHLQEMSGVFSIASHSVLQYFPDVTLQEQTG